MKVNCIAFAFNLAILAFVAMPRRRVRWAPSKKETQLLSVKCEIILKFF